MAMAAMMNQNDYMNNPFAYLIWMIFAMRMWNNQDGNQGNAIQSQLDAMRSQISDNQNSSLVMDAIRGNSNAITQLASNLNCDFNALNNAICCVKSGIQEVAGVNSNNQEHTWTSEQVQNVCDVLNLEIPDTSTIEDVTYTANRLMLIFIQNCLMNTSA